MNCQRRYRNVALGRDTFYLHSDFFKIVSKAYIIKMVGFFIIDNIFAMFSRRVFQLTVGILIDSNCDPLLAELCPYSYAIDFIQGLL